MQRIAAGEMILIVSFSSIILPNMENSQHRQVTNVILAVARWLGVWSSFNDSKAARRIIYSFYSVMMTCIMWFFVGTIIADLASNSEDLLIMTDDGCFLAGISVVIFKHVIFHIHRKKIIRLIADVYSPIDNLAKSSDRGVLALIKSTTLFSQIQVYTFSLLGAVLLLALLTLVPRENGSLPIRAKYPFNTTTGLKHIVAFAIQATAITIAIVAILFMDALVLCFGLFIIPQLEVLDSNYRHCQLKWPRGTFSTSIEDIKHPDITINYFIPFGPAEAHEINDSFEKRFKICIQHHHRLTNIVNDINSVFGSSMFYQLFASSSMICLTGFQVTLGANEFAVLLKFALYCGVALSQLFIWCMIGNILLHQSLTLGDSPWLSGWENERYTNFSFLIVIAMTKAQKSMELKAIHFYTLSMETFITILRASYSFFVLLTAITED